MKVRIGNTVYDSRITPILLCLSPREKAEIGTLPPHIDLHCIYPTGHPQAEIDTFMEEMARQLVSETARPVNNLSSAPPVGQPLAALPDPPKSRLPIVSPPLAFDEHILENVTFSGPNFIPMRASLVVVRIGPFSEAERPDQRPQPIEVSPADVYNLETNATVEITDEITRSIMKAVTQNWTKGEKYWDMISNRN